MKRKMLLSVISLTVIATIFIFVLYSDNNTQDFHNTIANKIVAVNEIEQLIRTGESEKAIEKSSELQQELRLFNSKDKTDKRIFILCSIYIISIFVIFGYIYFSVLRPFEKLKDFADKIAQGDFNVPLEVQRGNYFGKFTWAFESMRREITKLRVCEKEAINNNKTIIATLSHDIKTPIASIRAYAEGLEANLDTTHEKREKYLSIIMKKCDEVSKYTNDLVLHSLTDLDKLKFEFENFELCKLLNNVVEEISGVKDDVHIVNTDLEVIVVADKNRMTQIFENLISNARKYAKTDIKVFVTKYENNVEIHFRDYGSGIPDDDMPFIFEKFYRGKNSDEEQGSGLGLYIVKYIAEKMNGKVFLYNRQAGLDAIVSFPIQEIVSS